MNSDERIRELETKMAALAADRRRTGWRSRWAAIGAAVVVMLGGGTALHYASAAPGDVVQNSFVPIAPVRILDTRPAPLNVGGFVGPLVAGQTHTFQVTGVAGVPSNAAAVVLNVTVDATTGSSFLTVFPAAATRPLASNLNWVAGTTIPNLVTVKLGAAGQVSVFNNNGEAHVIADVAGYYVPGNDKFMSLPVAGVQSTNPFVGGGGENAGVPFKDNLNDSISYNLVLPPDYTPGGQILATFTWHTPASNCNVDWASDYVSVSRAGQKHVTGAGTATGMSNPGLIAAGAVPNIVHSTTISLASPLPSFTLQPGDSYTFGLFRRGTDSCPFTAQIDSMSIRYD